MVNNRIPYSVRLPPGADESLFKDKIKELLEKIDQPFAGVCVGSSARVFHFKKDGKRMTAVIVVHKEVAIVITEDKT